MARSIHTTRRDLKELERADYANANVKRKRREGIAAELERKRLIKSIEARPQRPVVLRGSAVVPVRVESEPFLYHAASAEDIHALLQRLPQGLSDALNEVVFCFGREYLRRTGPADFCAYDADPVSGRDGPEIIPGIYAASALGVYSTKHSSIWLFGYVLSPTAKRSVAIDLHLRLRTLNVFMHELAHHDDWMRRTARGRWINDGGHAGEVYAEAIGDVWAREYVIPYLQDRYPSEVQQYIAFVRQHTGIDLPLQVLAGDQRGHAKGNKIRVAGMMPLDRGVDELFEQVHNEDDPIEIRLSFAQSLKYVELYGAAMTIVDEVLARHPTDRRALRLKSWICRGMQRYSEAAELARHGLLHHPEDLDLMEELAEALVGLKLWAGAIDLFTRILQLSEGQNEHLRRSIYYARADARISSGDLAGAREDIACLRGSGTRYGKRVADQLEKRLA